MDNVKVANMVERIAQDEVEDAPLAMVDQAVDTMIAAAKIIEENLPKLQTQNVPQQAAVDAVQELMDEAIMPYLADIAKAMNVFGEGE